VPKKPRKRGAGILPNGRSAYGHQFIKLHHWVLHSAAYRSLDGLSRALLIELYSFYNGRNNGGIFLSVRDAAKRLNVSPPTAQSRFAVLRDRGFIKVNQQGSFDLKIRHATTYILTEYEYGAEKPTKDFMSWKPDPEKQKPGKATYTDGTNSLHSAAL